MRNHRNAKRSLGMPAFMAVALLLAITAWAKDKTPSKVVNLQNGQGKSVGTATLTPAAQGVSIKLNVHDLTPGDHGIHVHQTAKCDGPDFKSAGGHFNPDGKKHGLKALMARTLEISPILLWTPMANPKPLWLPRV